MRDSGKGHPRRSHSNKYVNKIWSNPRGTAQEYKGGANVLGQVGSKEAMGWGNEPRAVLERERHSEKEADHRATVSARPWPFLSEVGCSYRVCR